MSALTQMADILQQLAASGVEVEPVDLSAATQLRNVGLCRHAKAIGFCLVCCERPATSNDGERCETCDANFQEENDARI